MISINLQTEPGVKASNASSNATTSSNRPGGWPADMAPTVMASVTDNLATEGRKEAVGRKEEEEKWEERPIQWDELDGLDELLDVDTLRPATVQRAIEGHTAYVNARGDADVQADIWRRVAGMRGEQAA